MSFTIPISSLEHLSLIKVATSIWKTDRAISCLLNSQKRSLSFLIREILNNVELPLTLKEKVEVISQEINSEIQDWMVQWIRFPSVESSSSRALPIIPAEDVKPYLVHLRWNCNGTIDAKTMAEMVATDERIDLVSRYRIAGFFCLEEQVRSLWNQIDKKEDFADNDFIASSDDVMTSFLSFCDEGKTTQMSRCILNKLEVVFRRAAEEGNLVAAKYFWNELTPAQRDKTLKVVLEKEYYLEKPYKGTAVLCFLLSQMNSAMQLELLRKEYLKYSETVMFDWPFEELLKWPYHVLFTRYQSKLVTLMKPSRFFRVMQCFLFSVKKRDQSVIYADVANRFWKTSPALLKVTYLLTVAFSNALLYTNEDEISSSLNQERFLRATSGTYNYIGVEQMMLDRWDLISSFNNNKLKLLNSKAHFGPVNALSMYAVKNFETIELMELLQDSFTYYQQMSLPDNEKKIYQLWTNYGKRVLSLHIDRLVTTEKFPISSERSLLLIS